MSLTDTMIGAQSPIQFLEEMTSFAVPSICFAIALIAIVVMQILYFKTDRLLFIIIDFVLGFAAAVSALVTMDYYTTFKQIFDANKAYMTAAQLAECPDINFYVIFCLVSTIFFFGTLFISLMVLVIKKILESR
ncbi:MAG: hypothetical protein Q4A45_06160 [Clostridia bacterium]|nr:hypothetical protein [Clostridia bacterium]